MYPSIVELDGHIVKNRCSNSFYFQSQAKFSPERAKQCVTWIEEVTGSKLGEMKDQIDFGELLKDGSVLSSLINCLQPGSVKKINTLKAPFKQVIKVCQ